MEGLFSCILQERQILTPTLDKHLSQLLSPVLKNLIKNLTLGRINSSLYLEPKLPTVQPLGVVLGSAQRWQPAQAAVDGGVSSGEVHRRGSVKLPTGGDEGSGVVEGVVGTPRHPANLIVDFCQICQLKYRNRRR